MIERNRPITNEDLIRRYNLEDIKQINKTAKNNEKTLDKTNTILEEFIESTLASLEDLQDQVDGNITTWFFSGVPTLSNAPADDWTTDTEKNNHLGDLYYDQNTGYSYRFCLSDNVYSWVKLTDSDITTALAIANAAQDTADSKRRVFVTTPTTPYDVGDIWFDNDTDMYRCRAARSSGAYSSTDWIIATDYSNDDYAKGVEAVLNQFQQTVETDYTTKVLLESTQSSLESSVSSLTSKVEIDNQGMQSRITEVENRVSTVETDSGLALNIATNIYENGATKVATSTGYTFDSNGLNITASGTEADEIGSTLNNKGLSVYNIDNEELLYAGYDLNTKESVVRSMNLRVNKYFEMGSKSRFEDYTDENNMAGTGCFEVGGQ